MKVALYPAAAGLGNDAKKRCPSRKGRSKHSAHGLAVTSVAQATIDRPGRAPLKNRLPSPAAAGYWATFIGSLAGLIFSNLRSLRSVIATSYVDAQLPDRFTSG